MSEEGGEYTHNAAQEHARFEQLRRDLEEYNQWRLLPAWKRKRIGEWTEDDFDDMEKAMKMARAASTVSNMWYKGIVVFLASLIVVGPALKLLGGIFDSIVTYWSSRGQP